MIILMKANDDCKTWTRMLIDAKIIHCFLLASLAALHWINCKGLWIWSEDSTTREGIINLIYTMLSLVYHWCISHIATTVPAKHSTQICVVVCYKFQLYWPILIQQKAVYEIDWPHWLWQRSESKFYQDLTNLVELRIKFLRTEQILRNCLLAMRN